MKNPICPHCEEPVLSGELATKMMGGQIMHHECVFRLAVGSEGHIMGLCSCYGGYRDDDPAKTKREAAKASLVAYRQMLKERPPNMLPSMIAN